MFVSEKWKMLSKKISQILQHNSDQDNLEASCPILSTNNVVCGGDRFINTDGRRFVKDFQGVISEKVKYILMDHLNKYCSENMFIIKRSIIFSALSSVKPEYLLS